jgi:hypothetical protein
MADGAAEAVTAVEPAAGKRWTPRLYRPGDETGILALFREVAGTPRSLAHWEWKYRNNPGGPILVAVAEAEGGRIVGHYATIPARARVGGRPCRMIQVIDSLVAADFRQGLKRPGLFVQLALFYFQCVDQVRAPEPGKPEAEVRFMGYGFPVQTALRIGERLLGYTRLAQIGSLAASSDELGRRLQQTWQEAAYGIRVTDGVDASADRLWTRCADELPTATVRDQRYLNWRYRDCPDQTYRFLLAENRFTGELEGLAVLRCGWLDRPVVAIADWLVPGRALGAASALLRATLETARAERSGEIAAWFPSHFAIYMDLVALGFRPVANDYWLVARSFGSPLPPEEAGPTWYYTLGDSDIV